MFATEAEAFAEAERVYRAYNAEMLRLLSGDNTADAFQYVTGSLYEADLRVKEHMTLNGLLMDGEMVVSSFDGVQADIANPSVRIVAHVCVDLSNLRILDENGEDVTPEGPRGVAGYEATFVVEGTSLLIARSEQAGDVMC